MLKIGWKDGKTLININTAERCTIIFLNWSVYIESRLSFCFQTSHFSQLDKNLKLKLQSLKMQALKFKVWV